MKKKTSYGPSMDPSKFNNLRISRAFKGVDDGVLTHVALFLFCSSVAFAAPQFTTQKRARLYQKLAEANEHIEKKNWGEAEALLNKIHEARPNDFEVALKLSKVWMHLNRRKDALEVLITLHAQSKGAQKQKLEKRIRVTSRMFLQERTFQIYQEGVNFLWALKRTEAKERFVNAYDREPYNIEVLVRLAQCQILEGAVGAALENLKRARTLNPFNPVVRLWFGKALLESKNPQLAIQEFEGAQKGLPHSELLPLWWSEALVALGKREEAIRLIQEDLKKHPVHVQSLIALSQTRFPELADRTDVPAEYLWRSRRDLQIALSRFNVFKNARQEKTQETDLGLSPRSVTEIKNQIDKLLKDLDLRIKSADGRAGDQAAT